MSANSVQQHDKIPKPYIEQTNLAGVFVIRPKLFPDHRGFFCELHNQQEWQKELGISTTFQQDSLSFSTYGVLRGLHVQPDMGKLLTCIQGEIFDVAVNIDPKSADFGRSFSIKLSDKCVKSVYIPAGFAHGFQCLSPVATALYKCTAVHNTYTEFVVNPFDAVIAIKWPLIDEAVLSEKDKNAPTLQQIKEK